MFTTGKRSEITRSVEPGRAEFTPTGSDPINLQRRAGRDASTKVGPSPSPHHLPKFNSDLHPNFDQDKTSSQDTSPPVQSQTSDTNFLDRPTLKPLEMDQPHQAESLTQVVPAALQTKESLSHRTRTTYREFAFHPQDCSSVEGNPESKSGEEMMGFSLKSSQETSTVFLSQHSTLTTAPTTTLISSGLTDTDPQLTETLSRTGPDALTDLHKEEPFPEVGTGTSGLSALQVSSFTKQTHSSSTQSQEDHPRENSISRELQQRSTSLQDPGPPEPNSVSNMSCTEIRSRSGRRQQVFDSPSTLTCSQQSVHDHSMTSSSPAPQTDASAQRSYPHDHPNPPPSRLLTPDVCQPVAIREEIRLTTRIKGRPLSAPYPAGRAQTGHQAQSGDAQAALQPYWTRPLSRAVVMEGSPVVLEVEVMPEPEPTLTGWVAYNESHSSTQA